MFRVKQLAWAMSCISLMGGCTLYPWYQNKDGQTVAIKPVMEVHHTIRSADAMYQLGRYYQARVNYAEAIATYEKVLQADPGHVEAHNGLGIAHCLQDRHELALQYFRKAIGMAPLAAHLHNNLGYAHLVHGQEAEAVSAFERALRLEPQNQRAHRNLAAAYIKTGLSDKAAALTRAGSESTAATPIAVTAPAPGTPAGAPAGTASAAISAISPPMAVAAGEKQKLSCSVGARLVQVTPGVFEFRMTETEAVAAIAPGKIIGRTPTPQDSGRFSGQDIRIEVSNGNGVPGMARQVSDFLQQNGFARPRLTDRQPYQQVLTEIHYRPGHSGVAEEISRLMPMGAPMVESYNLRKDIHVRVMLGKDAVRQVAYLESPRGVQIAQGTVESIE
ncbi:Tetratricopeptide repeat-containing protein [Nitrosospira multiformis]|uniref:Tetratricopeptide repeat-containing protein n=1 Tax=Nitrosospira multiformis TaxID=1231 RepID=A0A1H8K4W9_9PROT|nr:LytR C-terminal domain-containing protein [Nitrosospira multiformis]SEN88022.1 Tetratricopeptide repeat-containing protein [Nitrosospira multiformis]